MSNSLLKNIEKFQDAIRECIADLKDKGFDVNGIKGLTDISKTIDPSQKDPVYLCSGADFSQKLYEMNENVTNVYFIYDKPPEDVETVDMSLNKDGSILAYKENNSIFVSGLEHPIYATDCSEMFYCPPPEGPEPPEPEPPGPPDEPDPPEPEPPAPPDDYSGTEEPYIMAYSNINTLSSGGISLITNISFKNFHTDQVTDMSSMFLSCVNLFTLNLEKFNITHIEKADEMFSGCLALTYLKASDWTVNSAIKNSNNMFYDCGRLTGNSNSKVSGEYAKPRSQGGYFI